MLLYLITMKYYFSTGSNPSIPTFLDGTAPPRPPPPSGNYGGYQPPRPPPPPDTDDEADNMFEHAPTPSQGPIMVRFNSN